MWERGLRVGVQVVVDGATRALSAGVEAAEAAEERRERTLERLRRARQIDEHKPFPFGERDALEWIVPFVEARHFVHVRGADQRAVERVRPGVVGALDRLGQAPSLRLTQPGAAMAAHIIESAQGAVL